MTIGRWMMACGRAGAGVRARGAERGGWSVLLLESGCGWKAGWSAAFQYSGR